MGVKGIEGTKNFDFVVEADNVVSEVRVGNVSWLNIGVMAVDGGEGKEGKG